MATSKSSRIKKRSRKTSRRSYKVYSKSYYEKRPIWQWIVIYAVIGTIVYGFIYYAVISPKGGYNYKSPKSTIDQNYHFKFQ